jgi:hypothetical protein
LIDRDVAALYGVTTKEVNQAVKNNSDKFPEGYITQLPVAQQKELVKNIVRLNNLKWATTHPKAVPEKSLYVAVSAGKTSRNKKNSLLKKSSEPMADVPDTDLEASESETHIELHFAVLKPKHISKRKKP